MTLSSASIHRYSLQIKLDVLWRVVVFSIMACLTTNALAVNPVPLYLGRLALCLQATQDSAATTGNSPIIYNPFKVYGNFIHYSLDVENEFMVVRDQRTNQNITLHLLAALEEAMQEWKDAIPGLNFIRESVYTGNAKKWYFELDDQTSPGRYGSATNHLKGGNPYITMYARGFSTATIPTEFKKFTDAMGTTDTKTVLEFILRHTAKHEIGHLLGFQHTPDPDKDDPADSTDCPTTVWLEPLPNIIATPPIMLERLTTYLEVMRNYHGQLLTINMINIAPQEAAIARTMFNADCPVTPQAANNQMSSRDYSDSSGSCPKPIKILSKGRLSRAILTD